MQTSSHQVKDFAGFISRYFNPGKYKKKNNIAILQSGRWNEILEQSIAKGREKNLSDGFVTQVLKTNMSQKVTRLF